MAASDYGVGNGQNENYQQNNTDGSGQGAKKPRATGPMLEQRWKDLNQKQRKKFGNDKSTFRDMRKDQKRAQASGATNSTMTTRKAGDKIADLRAERKELRGDKEGNAERIAQINKSIGRQENRIYGKGPADGEGSAKGIEKFFDGAASGAGGQKGVNRVSRKDMKELEQRYGKQAVVDYMDKMGKSDSGIKTQGGKAQNLLNKYKSELMEADPPEDTTDPGTGGGDDEQTEDTTGGGSPPASEDNSQDNDGIDNDGDDNNNSAGDDNVTGDDNTVTEGDDNITGDGNNTNNNSPGANNNSGDQSNNEGIIGGNDNTNLNNSDVTGDGNAIGSGAVGGGNSSNNSNDINVTGDGNSVYGGSQNNMSIVYGAGADKAKATPMSDLSMMGMYKPDDSPGAQASMVDMYQNLNSNAQKEYSDYGQDTAYKYISNAAATNPIDYEKLETNISSSIQNHYDMATEQMALYQGDVYNQNPVEFKWPTPGEPADSSGISDAADEAAENLEEV